MCDLVREAMAAGAIGLGSSTAEAHVGEGGLPVASRLADKAEFLALTQAMGESGRGLFQITIGPKTTHGGPRARSGARAAARRSGPPSSSATTGPSTCRSASPITEAFHREGVEVLPQISCRPLTMDFTMKNPYPFEGMPAWQQVMSGPSRGGSRSTAIPASAPPSRPISTRAGSPSSAAAGTWSRCCASPAGAQGARGP